MWNLPPPAGFRGLDPVRPVHTYTRHMPHWRQSGAIYFVTFRLADSLPQAKLRELAAWKLDWQQRHGNDLSLSLLDNYAREVFRRIEGWLDQQLGSCVLRDIEIAAMVGMALEYFAGSRYELGCYVVMPNHVHAVLTPASAEVDALETILHSWKRFSARQINERLRHAGPLWRDESFDRIVRDEEHLWRCLQYIGANPRKAGLTDGEFRRWLNPAWERCGWRFFDP